MTTNSLLSFQIHPNPSPKLISLLVIAGIYFLACQSYRFPGRRRVFLKSSPGLDVRSLVAKFWAGKTHYFVLKSKGGILVESLVFRLFLPFFSQVYNRRQNCRDKRIHNPSPSPLFKAGVFVVFSK